MNANLQQSAAYRENDEELFLNNLLLENGHGRRYDKVAEDWDGK